MVVLLEQELRSLSGERIERKLSVVDAKISRRKSTNVAASVDAYAARIAASLPSYPDPRSFLNKEDELLSVEITGPVEGIITVGSELFDLGEVKAEGRVVARTGSVSAATLVKAVLVLDPMVTNVRIPKGVRLQRLQSEWQAAVKRWQAEFDTTADKFLTGVTDPRTRDAVINNAMRLMHAK